MNVNPHHLAPGFALVMRQLQWHFTLLSGVAVSGVLAWLYVMRPAQRAMGMDLSGLSLVCGIYSVVTVMLFPGAMRLYRRGGAELRLMQLHLDVATRIDEIARSDEPQATSTTLSRPLDAHTS